MWQIRVSLFAAAMAAVLCLSGCETDDLSQTVCTASNVGDDFRVEASRAHGTMYIVAPDEFPHKSAPFDITRAAIHGDNLEVLVTSAGGCENHTYSVFWDGKFRDDHSPSVELFIVHDDNGDICEALVSDQVLFDLSPVKIAFAENASVDHSMEISVTLKGKDKTITYRLNQAEGPDRAGHDCSR